MELGLAEVVPKKVIPSETIGARIRIRSWLMLARLWVSAGGMPYTGGKKEKKGRFKCPYQDSNLGRRGSAIPQHDDLTTNLYGPGSNPKRCVLFEKGKAAEDRGWAAELPHLGYVVLYLSIYIVQSRYCAIQCHYVSLMVF